MAGVVVVAFVGDQRQMVACAERRWRWNGIKLTFALLPLLPILIYSSISIHSFTCQSPFTNSFKFTHSFSFTHSFKFTQSLPHSFPFTHSLPHSFPFIHSLPHSLIHSNLFFFHLFFISLLSHLILVKLVQSLTILMHENI